MVQERRLYDGRFRSLIIIIIIVCVCSTSGVMTAVYPASTTALVSRPQRRPAGAAQDCSDAPTDEEGPPRRRLTPLEQLNLEMCQDDRVVREITIGRRIGFYKVRGEIGCGNFSHVKLGIHALTKGSATRRRTFQPGR